MIFLFHDQRYWTEYIEPVLEDPKNFSIVKSNRNHDEEYLGLKLETFEPKKHHVILSAGHVYDETENNLIICRYLHSPGFNTHAFIQGYFRMVANHPKSDFRYLLLEEHYKLLLLAENLPEKHAAVLDHMIHDPRLSLTKVDPMIYKIRDLPQKHERKEGTGLIALSWLIAKEDPKKLTEIIKKLSKQLNLTIILHPLTQMMGAPDFFQNIEEFKGYANILFDLPREQMVELYDQNEFIITDGSGSCYEAILRGCKPLLVSDLFYQKQTEEFHTALDNGYLPFQDYSEINQYKTFDSGKFIDHCFPFLNKYSYEESKQIMRDEINGLM